MPHESRGLQTLRAREISRAPPPPVNQCQGKRNGGKGHTDEAHRRPGTTLPSDASAKGAEGTADEVSGHEKGVGTIGGLGKFLDARTLVAELQALRADINNDDRRNQSNIGVAEDVGHHPCQNLKTTAAETETVDAETVDIFADAAGSKGAGNATKAEHAHFVATGGKRGLGEMEGHARPDGEHGTESETGSGGIQAYAGMPADDLPKALHQSGIATLEIALHIGKHHEGDAHAPHHQHGGDEEHGAPTEPVADVAANNARSQDASQEAGEHNADVAALVGGF